MPPLRILLACDSAPLLDLVSLPFQQTEGIQIFETSDGMDAVQKAKEIKPDLVLLDLGLPNLDGIEALKRIHEISPQTKLLCLSHESNSEMIRETFRVGAQ